MNSTCNQRLRLQFLRKKQYRRKRIGLERFFKKENRRDSATLCCKNFGCMIANTILGRCQHFHFQFTFLDLSLSSHFYAVYRRKLTLSLDPTEYLRVIASIMRESAGTSKDIGDNRRSVVFIKKSCLKASAIIADEL